MLHPPRSTLASGFVVLDESHTAKDGSTKVYKTLNQIRKREPVDHGFKLAALSATPITVSLSKSLRSVLSLLVPHADLATFLAATQTIDSATRAEEDRELRLSQSVACIIARGILLDGARAQG